MFVRASQLADRESFADPTTVYVAVTRFDLPMPRWPESRRLRESGELPAWTARRVALFRQRCLPSMLAQSPRPHLWFLLCDRDGAPAADELRASLAGHGWIVPLPLSWDWEQRYAPAIRAEVAERCGAAWSRVCATRLDNDDSLHRSYHAALDEAVGRLGETPEAVALNFPFGAAWDGRHLRVHLTESQWFATVEPFDRFAGPYQRKHAQIAEVARLAQVFTDRPMYVHHRHEQNASGAWRQRTAPPLADPAGVLREFGLGMEVAPG